MKAPPAFELEATAVLDQLHSALADLIAGMRPRVERASELQKTLSLDKSLSWSVFNAARAEDSGALASLLPGKRAIERFFSAAASHGVPQDAIGRARAAFERFEDAVSRYAGNRDAFEAMVVELKSRAGPPVGGVPSSASLDLKHKRNAFRTNSILWGRQAKVVCATMIMHPAAPGRGGSEAPMLDRVFLKGMVGLHRTRDVPLHVIAHTWRAPTAGETDAEGPPEPLDPRIAAARERGGPDAGDTIALLPDFCSQPTPRFRLLGRAAGRSSHELVSEQVGPMGEVTYFIGEIGRADTAVPGSVPGAVFSLSKVIDVPVQMYVGDVLMHRAVWGTRPPEVRVYALPADGSREYRDSDRLPLSEKAEYLGEGLYAARMAAIPRYEELLAYAMKRMGWNPDEFRVFRCRVDYPVQASRIMMEWAPEPAVE